MLEPVVHLGVKAAVEVEVVAVAGQEEVLLHLVHDRSFQTQC